MAQGLYKSDLKELKKRGRAARRAHVVLLDIVMIQKRRQIQARFISYARGISQELFPSAVHRSVEYSKYNLPIRYKARITLSDAGSEVHSRLAHNAHTSFARCPILRQLVPVLNRCLRVDCEAVQDNVSSALSLSHFAHIISQYIFLLLTLVKKFTTMFLKVSSWEDENV